ncbi:MAG: VOC family protein [Acidimicrobiales bacterium]
MTALVPLDGFYHFGMVVQDFELALDELGANLGLEWASVQRRVFEVRQPNGIVEADFRVTYSVTGPPHFEIIEPTPGTIWTFAGGGVHHLGYWSDDLAGDSKRLTSSGYSWEGTYHNPDVDGPFGFTYHTLPGTQLRVELVDRARKPAFDTWMAGGEFPSALDDEGMK